MKEEEKEHPVWIRKHGPAMRKHDGTTVCPTRHGGEMVISMAKSADKMSEEIGESVTYGKYNTNMNNKSWETDRRATVKEILSQYTGAYLDQKKNSKDALYHIDEKTWRVSLGANRLGTACIANGKLFATIVDGASSIGMDNSKFGKICRGEAKPVHGIEVRFATELDVLEHSAIPKKQKKQKNKQQQPYEPVGDILLHIQKALTSDNDDEKRVSIATALVDYELERRTK